MTSIGRALAGQFRGAFEGLRDIIEKLPDDQWYVGATHDQIPAWRAHHAIFWVGRHCRPPGGHHPITRVYRNRLEMLAYLESTARQVRAALEGTADDQFALRVTQGAHSRTLLAHWLYALRHLQHHVGQLSSTLRERGLQHMKWH